MWYQKWSLYTARQNKSYVQYFIRIAHTLLMCMLFECWLLEGLNSHHKLPKADDTDTDSLTEYFTKTT